MRKFAYFNPHDGRVLQWIDTDAMAYNLPDASMLHACSDAEWELQHQGEMMVKAGTVVPYEAPALEVDQLKAAKNAEINVERAAANTSSFDHGGKTFSCDQLSRSDIDGVNGYVALYGALPPGFPGAWKAVDNTYLPIADVDAWKVFYTAMVAKGAANFAHAQELKAHLAAATTPEAVAAIIW
jgi:hypothetical protein